MDKSIYFDKIEITKNQLIIDSLNLPWVALDVSLVEAYIPALKRTALVFDLTKNKSHILCSDSSNWALERRDFSLEVWFYPFNYSHGDLISTNSYINDFSITLYEDGGFGYYDSREPHYVSGHTYVLNQWNHLALTRHDLEFSLFLDGQKCLSKFSDIDIPHKHPTVVGGSSYWNYDGYIGNINLSSACLYNANFSPKWMPTVEA